MYCSAEKHHVVPDTLLQELVDLRTSFASFLLQFEKVLKTSPGAQETFVGMLQGILLRTFTSFKLGGRDEEGGQRRRERVLRIECTFHVAGRIAGIYQKYAKWKV